MDILYILKVIIKFVLLIELKKIYIIHLIFKNKFILKFFSIN